MTDQPWQLLIQKQILPFDSKLFSFKSHKIRLLNSGSRFPFHSLTKRIKGASTGGRRHSNRGNPIQHHSKYPRCLAGQTAKLIFWCSFCSSNKTHIWISSFEAAFANLRSRSQKQKFSTRLPGSCSSLNPSTTMIKVRASAMTAHTLHLCTTTLLTDSNSCPFGHGFYPHQTLRRRGAYATTPHGLCILQTCLHWSCFQYPSCILLKIQCKYKTESYCSVFWNKFRSTFLFKPNWDLPGSLKLTIILLSKTKIRWETSLRYSEKNLM